MKKINIRFEQEQTIDTVDIVIRAASRDAQVDALMESLTQRDHGRLTVLNQDNCPTVIDENRTKNSMMILLPCFSVRLGLASYRSQKN